jgi:putative component of toxin-antitoxin plasmid stabilization module
VLVVGGDKASQGHDIRTAQAYWKDYQEAQHGKAKP